VSHEGNGGIKVSRETLPNKKIITIKAEPMAMGAKGLLALMAVA